MAGLDFGTVGNLFGDRRRVGEGFSTDKQQQAILDNKIDERFIKTEALDNALNVMELQVAAAVTPTDLGNMEIEIFSDADGFINTVDTGNSTAGFNTDKYSSEGTRTEYVNGDEDGTTTTITMTLNAKRKGFIDKVFTELSAGSEGDWTVTIDQGGTIATDTITSTTSIITFTFVEGDYSTLIEPGAFTVTATRVSGSRTVDTQTSQTHDDINFSFTSQTALTSFLSGPLFYTAVNSSGIVQTNVITVVDRIVDFMVVAYKKVTTGTGTLTYDLSFDNGTTFQTGLPFDTIINVQRPGTQLILKVNLNVGVSDGTAECKGYGVRYWV